MHQRVGTLLIIIVTVLMALASPAFAGGNGTKDRSTGAAAPTYTEDNDTNDGGTKNNVVDAGDNAHPSGRDRSVEPGGSGNQGRARSDPDDDGRGPDRSNGGADKPNGPGGVDLADQDGNNGCGNDDDFEDDNEGRCGGRRHRTSATVRIHTPTTIRHQATTTTTVGQTTVVTVRQTAATTVHQTTPTTVPRTGGPSTTTVGRPGTAEQPPTTVTVGRPATVPTVPANVTTELLPPLVVDLPRTGVRSTLALAGGALVAGGSVLSIWAAQRRRRLPPAANVVPSATRGGARAGCARTRSAPRVALRRHTAPVRWTGTRPRTWSAPVGHGHRARRRLPPIRGPSAT